MSRPMRCLHRVRTFGAIYTQCDNTVRDGHPSQLCGMHRSHTSTRPTDAVESGQNTSASRAMGERSGSQ